MAEMHVNAWSKRGHRHLCFLMFTDDTYQIFSNNISGEKLVDVITMRKKCHFENNCPNNLLHVFIWAELANLEFAGED